MNTRTDGQTQGRTFRLIERIGPEGRCFENIYIYISSIPLSIQVNKLNVEAFLKEERKSFGEEAAEKKNGQSVKRKHAEEEQEEVLGSHRRWMKGYDRAMPEVRGLEKIPEVCLYEPSLPGHPGAVPGGGVQAVWNNAKTVGWHQLSSTVLDPNHLILNPNHVIHHPIISSQQLSNMPTMSSSILLLTPSAAQWPASSTMTGPSTARRSMSGWMRCGRARRVSC